ncbi:MAG: hypothetical protein FWF50_03325, partial [Defluviitaleaceae bacterium]|nr:hypothetical protein [Defluviitaleaceae bacterium]
MSNYKKISKILAIPMISLLIPMPTLAVETTATTRSILGRSVTYVELDLSEWQVYGFTTPQLFGRRTASLQEFWNATSNYHGYETLIFPVN